MALPAALPSDRPVTGRPHTRGRVAVLGALLVGLLALVIWATYLVSTRHATVPGTDWELNGEVSAEQEQREAVLSTTEQLMRRMNTYGPGDLEGKQMPAYREEVAALLSPKFAEEFHNTVSAAEATVAQAGMARTAEVTGVGVAALDEDSAQALVAGSFTNSYPGRDGARVEDAPLPFRFEVDLVRIDGEWLVDGFAPVLGGEQAP